MKRHNFSGITEQHMEYQFHIDHMVQLDRDKIQAKFLKEKKWQVTWETKLRTIQNIEIIKSDIENNLLYLKGSIPGSKNCEVLVKKAVKNIKKLTVN